MADETLMGGSLELLVRALKNARLQRSLSIDEIGRLVKIRSSFIEKLEEGDFSFLPPLYVFSYIRKYADELGVGNEEQFKKCREELGIPGTNYSLNPSRSAAADTPVDYSAPKGFQGREVLVIAAVVIIAIVGLVAFFLIRH
ncbi:MAG TPA: helix-turn-helix transcriptional regulator [Chlorobaculum sp.]|nr:helix-turn-helix transcriptional regulator [Chlorobaculum sp.]